MANLSSGQVRGPYFAADEHQLMRSNLCELLLYHFYRNFLFEILKNIEPQKNLVIKTMKENGIKVALISWSSPVCAHLLQGKEL